MESNSGAKHVGFRKKWALGAPRDQFLVQSHRSKGQERCRHLSMRDFQQQTCNFVQCLNAISSVSNGADCTSVTVRLGRQQNIGLHTDLQWECKKQKRAAVMVRSVFFPHAEKSQQPSKRSKKDGLTGTGSIAMVWNFKKLGCVSRDIDSLQEGSVRSQKTGRRSSRSDLRLRSKLGREKGDVLADKLGAWQHKCAEFADPLNKSRPRCSCLRA